MVDAERGIIQGTEAGVGLVTYNLPSPVVAEISVNDTEMTPLSIDPVLASLRLNLNNEPVSRLGEAEVTLEILSELFVTAEVTEIIPGFFESTEVTVSAILQNGRRIIITDPAELQLQSSNTSVLAVDRNFVIPRRVGTAELNVTWIVCETILGSSTIQIDVVFHDNIPIFANNLQTAGIIENSPLGASITTVFANDLDFVNEDSARRDTEYRFRDDVSTHGGLFLLDKITGVVSLNGPLDRETRDSYELRIEATDRAQRQAEQRLLNGGGGGGGGSQQPQVDDGSADGSGLGGSGEILVPEGTTPPPPPVTPPNIDAVTVS